MTDRYLTIFFACTTIGWAVYHFFVVRKLSRALETTIRMSNPKRSPSAMTGHHHVSNPHGHGAGGGGASYTVFAGGGGGGGQVSVKWPYGNPRVGGIVPTPSSSGGKKVKK